MGNSLNEQIAEASQEAIASAKSATEPTDTGASAESGQETSSSAEKPQFLSTISNEDWAAMDEKQRSNLTKLGKSLYSDYQDKAKELSEVRKLKAEMDEDPGLAETLRSAVLNYRKGSTEATSPSAMTPAQREKVVTEAGDLLDELKADDDPQVRANALKLEQAIVRRLEKSSDPTLKKEVADLKTLVSQLAGHRSSSHRTEIERELSSLSEAWTPVLDKYKDKILIRAEKYTDLDLDRLLMLTLTPAEYKAALRAEAEHELKKQANKAKKEAVVSPNNRSADKPIISADDTRKTRMGDRPNFKSIISKMLPEIKRGASNLR